MQTGLRTVFHHCVHVSSWNTTRMTNSKFLTTLPATDCDIFRYDGLCVSGVLDLGVAFQLMHTTSYRPPGSPPGFKLQSYSARPYRPPVSPPGFKLQSYSAKPYRPPGSPPGFKLQSYSAKPSAPPRRAPCTHFSKVLQCSIYAQNYTERWRERETDTERDTQRDTERDKQTDRQRNTERETTLS